MKWSKLTKPVGIFLACLVLSLLMLLVMSTEVETLMQIDLSQALFKISRYLIYLGVILILPHWLLRNKKLNKPQVKRLRYSLLIMAAVYELLVWNL